MTNPSESVTSDPAPVKAWPASRIAAAASTVLWLFMTLAGISLIEGIRGQHVPGYPNDGQLWLYVAVPLIGLVGSAVILGFAKALPSWAKRIGIGIGIGISLFALLLVFMMFGGGA